MKHLPGGALSQQWSSENITVGGFLSTKWKQIYHTCLFNWPYFFSSIFPINSIKHVQSMLVSHVGDELWNQKGLSKILCGWIGSTEWISKMWMNFCLSLDASPCSHVINLAAARVRARVWFRVWSVKQQSSWSMMLCILIRSGERVIEQ